MKKLEYECRQYAKRNREGSRSTQDKHKKNIILIAQELSYTLGFPHMQMKSLKPKHIDALINHWIAKGLSSSTIKSRTSTLRKWAREIGKPSIIAKSNKHYNIADRTYISEDSKAKDIPLQQQQNIKDSHVLMSVRLAKAFGLRVEESIKFTPSYADMGDHIRLKGSWCKGGRPRVVPILSDEQRHVLDQAKRLVGSKALIPDDLLYIQQRHKYQNETYQAGIRNIHGLRHRYAQQRYKVLTGWDSPHAGGPSIKELSAKDKVIDEKARLTIISELGHNRLQISINYLGR